MSLCGEFTCAAWAFCGPQEGCGSCLFLAEQMDELLQRCFLCALKYRVKKADLPLLTSTLLGSHMFSCWYGRHGVGWGLGGGSLSCSLVVGWDKADGGIVLGT